MPIPASPSPAIRLEVMPEKAALLTNGVTRVRVLVRIQAPQPLAGSVVRHPLHLALVLDRSGSMNGVPLEEAKRCTRNIIDSLADGDRAAIFAFDDEILCVAPLTPASDKLALGAAVATIQAGGSTNLHGGWRAGADELAGKLGSEDVHRVILLSDGGANAGETDLEQITLQCKALANGGVSTSTYGLGNNFNETLMLAMAAAGRGNAYYGQTAADLADPFAAEFALLTSLCARGLVLKVNAPNGIGVRLRNDFVPVDGQTMSWSLPDLAFASEAWAVLEFDIPPSEAPVGTAVSLPITLSVYAATQDSAPIFMIAAMPPLHVVEAETLEAMPADALVARRVLELDAGDALDTVREAIESHDWVLATRLVEEAQARFAHHAWATAILAAMARLVAQRDEQLSAKEARYGKRSLNVRLSSVNEAAFGFDEASIPEFLKRKGEQGKGKRPA